MRYHIVLWKWEPGQGVARAYDYRHVNTMCEMIRRNIAGVDAHVRVLCVTDDAGGISECETFPLWSDCWSLVNATKANLPSCYRRLKLYDPATQRELGIDRGDRIVSLDLDSVITGPLAEVLEVEGRFVGWQLAGMYHPRVFNGSFQMFTAGDLSEIWSEFDPVRSPLAAKYAGFQGSDQSWLSWKLVDKPGSNHIPYPTFASYPLHCRGGDFRARHRIVFFHGKLKPWHPEARAQTPWISRYWRF